MCDESCVSAVDCARRCRREQGIRGCSSRAFRIDYSKFGVWRDEGDLYEWYIYLIDWTVVVRGR